ncbi:hypothetical protein [Chitinophaga caseinilytica]|uniref:hypothetical protein n=1 Tax=Chitinophaga caseinilytica TaxID=2267521 RepID=UPI003C2B4222
MHINYIHQLSCFFFRLERHSSMRPSHVSLYLALFRQWNSLKFCVTMTVSRLQLMLVSKIGSKDCYHRTLKELHAWGFLEYHPAEHPRDQAKVSMKNLTLIEQQLSLPVDADCILADIEPENEPKPVPKPGHINKTIQTINRKENTPPQFDEVLACFEAGGHAEREARKFFNYYESTGWMQGGHTPIVNWKAKASKWMLDKHTAKQRGWQRKNELDSPQDYGAPL